MPETSQARDDVRDNRGKIVGAGRVDQVGQDKVDGDIENLRESSQNACKNVYTGKRNFIHQLMDVALLMANVSQLKALVSLPDDDTTKYREVVMVFVVMSIVLQVVFTLCMLGLWSKEKKAEECEKRRDECKKTGRCKKSTGECEKRADECKMKKTGRSNRATGECDECKKEREKQETLENSAFRLDRVGNVLVMTITVANIFVTGFGVSGSGSAASTAATANSAGGTPAPRAFVKHSNNTIG